MATFRNGTGVKVLQTRLQDVGKATELLSSVEVLVGVPEDESSRTDEDSVDGINNASLAYIHDNGAPEQNIPARPFMTPGMEDAEDRITNKLGQILVAVVSKNGGAAVVEQGFHQVGIIAATSIKKTINAGIDPPLSERTLQERASRGRKGAKTELANRAAGLGASTKFAKPLVDTGQMRNSITYAIRARKLRDK